MQKMQIPIGTHEWEKFIKPEELISITKKYDLTLNDLRGVKLNLLTNNWGLSADKSVNYIAKFIKI